MNLARFSVTRPVTAGIISFALFVLGVFSYFKMPVSLYPDVNVPFIAVTVPYPGAAPEQVESNLLKPLEAELSGLKNLKRLVSFARPNVGQVVLGFEMTADGRGAADAVREKVSAVKAKFPSDAKEPIVHHLDVGAVPVMVFGIESKADPEVVKKQLDSTLVRTLQNTSGVSEARVQGLGDELLELQLDAQKLNALRVPAIDVYEQLALRTKVIPWGDVQQKGERISVARGLPPSDAAYWEQQSITLKDGRGLRLSEVGSVKRVRDDLADGVFINGNRGLSLVVTKRADANTVKTVSAIREALGTAALPEGVKLFKIIDQSEYIQENSKEVWIALFIGGLFAVAVILLFLTDVKSALISAAALPVSVAGSFIFMNALGFSVNMMSLLALSLAIGLLIDDAVVVRESIYKEMENGMSGKEAAVVGTDKVAAPVLATTLAVIAVFLPVSMMDGIVGQFFKEFGLTICISVALSIWVAFTLDPMLSAYFAGRPQPLRGKFWDAWRAFLVKTEVKISRWGLTAFRRPKLMLAVSVLLLIGSAALTAFRGMDFMAYEDRGQMVLNIHSRPGTTRAGNEALATEAVQRLRGLEGLQDTIAQIGVPGDQNETLVRFVFKPKSDRAQGMLAIKEQASRLLQGLDAEWLLMDPPFIEGTSQEAPVAFYIAGEDLKALRVEAQRVAEEVRKIPGIGGVRIQSTAASGSLEVQLKQDEIGFAGTTSQAVEGTGRIALTGIDAGTVGEENLPFRLRLRPEDRELSGTAGADFTHLLGTLLVPTMRGPTALSQLADVKSAKRESSIDREQRSRKVTVWGTLDRTAPYDQVLSQVERVLTTVKAPFTTEVVGDKMLLREVQGSFVLAVIGSLFFIFVILASQFENLMRPFIILLTLPLAVIGGFLGLAAFGLKLALGSIIGLILLIGLAAKNGILLVDAIGEKEKSMSLREAVRASILERTRPILMTSIAMIFGMLPTALMGGGGSEFRAPMAIAIIGGVISSTFLSFLVVPAVFGLIRASRLKRVPGRVPAPARAVVTAALLACVPFVSLPRADAAASIPKEAKETKEASVPEAAGLLWKAADPAAVRALIGAGRAASAESASVESAEIAAAGARSSALLAFVGGAKISLERKLASPGIKQELVLPLPALAGGPVSTSVTLLPEQKTELTFGWQVPVLNLQAISGLRLSARLQEQVPLVRTAKREAASVEAMRDLLEAELALQSRRSAELQERGALARLESVREKMRAGTASKADEVQAQLGYQGAKAAHLQARTNATEARARFAARTGKELPADGIGLPEIPFAEGAPFRPTAVAALMGMVAVQNAAADLADAVKYPSVSLSAGYQKQWLTDAPKPQKFLQLGVEWNILDAGNRVRTEAQSRSQALDLLSQARALETELAAKHATLAARRVDLREGLEAAAGACESAISAQRQTGEAVQAGVMKPHELRLADEGRLKAELGLLQARAGLQALALESQVLAGTWLAWIEGP